MKKRILTFLLVLVIVLVAAAGGTLAYLQDKTEEVKNVFTTSDVDIELAESTENSYQMIPGYTIKKDPKVTVKADSEKCYVFVKVDESENFKKYLTYNINSAWTQLVDNERNAITGVYYKVFDDTNADQTESVLADDNVKVKDEVTKASMDAITEETKPTLTFKAYACQFMKTHENEFGAYEAWELVNS